MKIINCTCDILDLCHFCLGYSSSIKLVKPANFVRLKQSDDYFCNYLGNGESIDIYTQFFRVYLFCVETFYNIIFKVAVSIKIWMIIFLVQSSAKKLTH